MARIGSIPGRCRTTRNVDVSGSRYLIGALKRPRFREWHAFSGSRRRARERSSAADERRASRYFGARFRKRVPRINPQRAVGMRRRNRAGWFSGRSVPKSGREPSWSSVRFWDSTTHSVWNCSLPSPSLARSPHAATMRICVHRIHA